MPFPVKPEVLRKAVPFMSVFATDGIFAPQVTVRWQLLARARRFQLHPAFAVFQLRRWKKPDQIARVGVFFQVVGMRELQLAGFLVKTENIQPTFAALNKRYIGSKQNMRAKSLRYQGATLRGELDVKSVVPQFVLQRRHRPASRHSLEFPQAHEIPGFDPAGKLLCRSAPVDIGGQPSGWRICRPLPVDQSFVTPP